MYPVATYARERQFSVWDVPLTERDRVHGFLESYTPLYNNLVRTDQFTRTKRLFPTTYKSKSSPYNRPRRSGVEV